LILNEAISNSFKHAFRSRTQGNICVRLRQSADGTFELSVEDDGVGLPPEVTPETSSSLGLRLILILANQLHGTLEIRRHPGTTIILTVKSHPGQEANANHAT
jgi:two-component sensor histidine kinase